MQQLHNSCVTDTTVTQQFHNSCTTVVHKWGEGFYKDPIGGLR